LNGFFASLGRGSPVGDRYCIRERCEACGSPCRRSECSHPHGTGFPGGYARRTGKLGAKRDAADSRTVGRLAARHDREARQGCLKDQLAKKIPCRYIPLNEAGETIDSLYRHSTQEELEAAFAQWLKTAIARLQREKKERLRASEHPVVHVRARFVQPKV